MTQMEAIRLAIVTSLGMGLLIQVMPIRLVPGQALSLSWAAKLVGYKPETAGASTGRQPPWE